MTTIISFCIGLVLGSAVTFFIVGATKTNEALELYEEGFKNGYDEASKEREHDKIL